MNTSIRYGLMALGVGGALVASAYKKFFETDAVKSSEAKIDLPRAEIPTHGLAALNHPPEPGRGEKKDLKEISELSGLFKSGDYAQALKKAQALLADPDTSPAVRLWVEKQIPTILTSLGWTLIQSGQCEHAIERFEQSKKLQNLTETTKGLAYCYYKLKSLNAAEDEMLNYLKTNRIDPSMSMIYADILESQSRFEEAAEILGSIRTSENDPEQVNIKNRLNSMRAKISEGHLQASFSTAHFLITYRPGEHEPLVNITADTLESALTEFTDLWGMREPQQPIEVLLYPETRFGHLVSYGPKWAQGLYDGRLRIQIKPEFIETPANSAYARLLRHELVHALLGEQVDRRELPYWFNEGIAMYLECLKGCPEDNAKSLGGNFLSKEMFHARFVDMESGNATLVYNQSIFMIRTLVAKLSDREPHPVFTMIAALDKRSDLSSDGILKSVGLTFDGIYAAAKQAWNKSPRKSQ